MPQVPLGKYTEVSKKKICWDFILGRYVIFAMKERNTSGFLMLQELVYSFACATVVCGLTHNKSHKFNKLIF